MNFTLLDYYAVFAIIDYRRYIPYPIISASAPAPLLLAVSISSLTRALIVTHVGGVRVRTRTFINEIHLHAATSNRVRNRILTRAYVCTYMYMHAPSAHNEFPSVDIALNL